MALFGKMYERVMSWARHPKASYYLGATSFAESSFFPVPVDVLLAPMTLARRDKAWFYAGLATITSVAGAILGYYIGIALFAQVAEPIIAFYHFEHRYAQVTELFEQYGIWIIFVAGFSPIPYKVFTIAAGVAHMPLLPFILTSLVARGARFYLVSWLVYIGGDKIEDVLQKRIEQIGWAVVVLIVVAVVVFKVMT
jgi:membrane protein YqaA with SNARE-associated domain